MRNLPPRMSNQLARKGWEWELESASDSVFASDSASALVSTSHEENLTNLSSDTSVQTDAVNQDEFLGYNHAHLLDSNIHQQIYEDTRSRTTLRSGWAVRGGRWG